MISSSSKRSNLFKKGMDLIKLNPRYFCSLLAAFGGSYAVGAITATAMQFSGYSEEAIALASQGARLTSFFAINLPLHRYLHKEKYQNNEESTKEMKTLGFSNAVGAILNLTLQPSFHYFAMHNLHIKNPEAFLGAYLFATTLATGTKLGIDIWKGVLSQNKKSSSLETRLKESLINTKNLDL
jgi:hypothetical protein